MYSMAALHSTHYSVINTLSDYIMDALIVIFLDIETCFNRKLSEGRFPN